MAENEWTGAYMPRGKNERKASRIDNQRKPIIVFAPATHRDERLVEERRLSSLAQGALSVTGKIYQLGLGKNIYPFRFSFHPLGVFKDLNGLLCLVHH
jgi:hypothetical protein